MNIDKKSMTITNDIIKILQSIDKNKIEYCSREYYLYWKALVNIIEVASYGLDKLEKPKTSRSLKMSQKIMKALGYYNY